MMRVTKNNSFYIFGAATKGDVVPDADSHRLRHKGLSGAMTEFQSEGGQRLIVPSTSGQIVRLADPMTPLTVVYCPRTGQPDRDPPGGLAAWDAIPGARGCTPQSCAYCDQYEQFRKLGVRVFGLSTQTTEYQQEMVRRLHLPFPVLSDRDLRFTLALGLPTFEVHAMILLKRLTLVIHTGRIEHFFYPVFPPDKNAEQVLEWLGSLRR